MKSAQYWVGPWHAMALRKPGLMILLILLLVACTNQQNRQAPSPVSTLIDFSYQLPDGRSYSSKARKIELMGQPMLLTQDDLLLPYKLSTQGSVITSGRLWIDKTVPYILDSSLGPNARTHAQNAIAHWESKTSIRFKARTTESDYVVIIGEGSGCWSNLGRIGGGQAVNLSEFCGFGTAVHELGHALGLFHEQSRNDRDNYVTIHYQNIRSDMAYNFDKAGPGGSDSGAYDFDSIMHYHAWAFSINGQPTIVPVDPSRSLYSLGQRSGLSSGDLAAIEQLYASLKPKWTAPATLTLAPGVVNGSVGDNVFNLSNTGLTRGDFTITTGAPFSLSQQNGTLLPNQSTTITVSSSACTDLNPQTGSLTISGGGATYTVNLTRNCVSSLSPAAWKFSPGTSIVTDVVGGLAPPPVSITLTNTGGQTGTYDLSSSASWLTFSPTKGTLGSQRSIALTVNVANCTSAGAEAASISDYSTSAFAAFTRQCSPAQPWTYGPTSLSFSDTADPSNSQAAPAQTIQVSNNSTTTTTKTSYRFTPDQPWITVTPNLGSLAGGQSAQISVVVSDCLGVGESKGKITFNIASIPTTEIPITRTCTQAPQPKWAMSTNSLSFVEVGDAAVSKNFILSNIGNATGTYSFQSNQAWLKATPLGGDLAAGQNTSISVEVAGCSATSNDTGELSLVSGEYVSATITVTRQCAPSPPPQPQWTLSTHTLNFANMGSAAVSQNLILSNTGNAVGSYRFSSNLPWLKATPASGSLGASQSTSISVEAAGCTGASNDTGELDLLSGATVVATVSISRQCVPNPPPATPDGLQLSMSSQGRIFVYWNESLGAIAYEFEASFDGQSIPVSGQAPSQGPGQVGAVAQFLSTPEASDKQGKMMCLWLKAINANEVSAASNPVCTSYRYYILGAQSPNSSLLPKIFLGR